MANPRLLLPNAPIAEVVCELRFHGDLNLFSAWGKIHADLRGEFPQLFVPVAAPGLSPLLQHVQLANAQNTRAVLLSINSLGFTVRDYQGFERYIEALSRVHAVFLAHQPSPRFTRFGLRYVNVLPEFEPSAPGSNVIHPCLKLKLTGWGLARGKVSQQPALRLSVSLPKNLTLLLNIYQGEAMLPQAQPQIFRAAGPVLDFDISTTSPESLDALGAREAFLMAAHEAMDATFFDLVTSEYYDQMKG